MQPEDEETLMKGLEQDRHNKKWRRQALGMSERDAIMAASTRKNVSFPASNYLAGSLGLQADKEGTSRAAWIRRACIEALMKADPTLDEERLWGQMVPKVYVAMLRDRSGGKKTRGRR